MLSFFCQPCDREFTTIAGRIRHQETAVVHKNAYCNPCDRLFVHWNALSSHLVHSDAHDYCSICEVHFDDRSELNDHTAVEHPTCCGRKFKNQLGLHEHLRQADKHAGRYCVEHKRLFDTKGNLETVCARTFLGAPRLRPLSPRSLALVLSSPSFPWPSRALLTSTLLMVRFVFSSTSNRKLMSPGSTKDRRLPTESRRLRTMDGGVLTRRRPRWRQTRSDSLR